MVAAATFANPWRFEPNIEVYVLVAFLIAGPSLRFERSRIEAGLSRGLDRHWDQDNGRRLI